MQGGAKKSHPRAICTSERQNSASLVAVPGALGAIGCYRRATGTSRRGPAGLSIPKVQTACAGTPARPRATPSLVPYSKVCPAPKQLRELPPVPGRAQSEGGWVKAISALALLNMVVRGKKREKAWCIPCATFVRSAWLCWSCKKHISCPTNREGWAHSLYRAALLPPQKDEKLL